MRINKWLILLIAIVLDLVIIRMPIFAINGKSNLATLQGLNSIGVLVEKLPSEVEKGGLIRNQLQSEVELKLRNAGIRVLTREECSHTPGEPYLYINININITKTESEIYPYNIDAMFIQKVSLLRNPKKISYAVTWSTGGIGSIHKQLLSQLRDSVNDIVDIFIKNYLNENPK